MEQSTDGRAGTTHRRLECPESQRSLTGEHDAISECFMALEHFHRRQVLKYGALIAYGDGSLELTLPAWIRLLQRTAEYRGRDQQSKRCFACIRSRCVLVAGPLCRSGFRCSWPTLPVGVRQPCGGRSGWCTAPLVLLKRSRK